MTSALPEDEKLKNIFKAALIEVLEEHGDLLREAFGEAIENIALARAIEEAEGGANVSREAVFAILESEP
jgi:hypothetical protein